MAEPSSPVAPRGLIRFMMYGLAAFWLIADQLTKWWAESQLSLGVYVPVLGDYLGWRLVYNPGAAFGIASDYTWVLAIVAALAVVGLAWFSTRVTQPLWVLGVSALLGGAISHLGDRLFREPGFAIGHIVDFIDYAGFFVGNVADIALVGGAGILILASFLSSPSGEDTDTPPIPSPALDQVPSDPSASER